MVLFLGFDKGDIMEKLAELVKKTKQELTDKEEKQIRSEVYSILETLGRNDVIGTIEEVFQKWIKTGVQTSLK